ncbi:glycosyltransferase family 2 protein [Paraburkholderia pallida]|uniref:Glycosyltransferase family 2 protein n=1 Tax=Paraburkholderia pallida TaxID=2547399 RepID=A0A4P7CWI9_9BURK|nr:glycosyltransferase family 2 protein [Paraburkholderia pallida]QBQ98363.1 glycosyltransferase family 2 protein [Paraburkholderia pallida]
MNSSVVGDATTGTVVVFYRPDAGCIARANRLASFGPCVVVDNTEKVCDAAALGLDPRIHFLANGANLGIATAINQGVEALIAHGCTSAILFDQDSEPSDELLRALPRAMEGELARGVKVALVGPAYEDARLGGIAPFVRFGMWRLQRIAPVGTRPLEVDFLITSGSCINLAAWPVIGPMDDALFIDFVDLEWCVRARKLGFSVLGAPALKLAHSLGGDPVRVFGRAYPGHGALRHYYQFRNAIALMKRSYMPWSWKSTELVKLPGRLVIYGLFMSPRSEHLRMALLGIWHGLTGRLGALSRG